MQFCKRSGSIRKAPEFSQIPKVIGPFDIVPDGSHVRTVTFRPRPSPDYGEAIRWMREELICCHQAVFGAIAGTSGATVSRWEAGTKEPWLSAVHRLEAFCREQRLPLPPDWITNPGARRAALLLKENDDE